MDIGRDLTAGQIDPSDRAAIAGSSTVTVFEKTVPAVPVFHADGIGFVERLVPGA